MKPTLMLRALYILPLLLQIACMPVSSELGGNTRPSITTAQSLYFAETGHTVSPPFLSFYTAHPNPSLLGYPITEAIEHEGWLVQYFQNVRLEFHPENEPAYRVTVGWLGQHLHRTQPPGLQNNDGLYFAETGHTVNGDFQAFFVTNGDSVQFGRPISGPFVSQGQLVQDFQSARFIWRPHRLGETSVQLAPLGETYFLSSGLSLDLLNPRSQSAGTTRYEPQTVALPQAAAINLQYEVTSHPNVIRVSVTVLVNHTPVVGYSPSLAWLNQVHQLPPTNKVGHTHTLVRVDHFDLIEFSLYDPGQPQPLSQLIFYKE